MALKYSERVREFVSAFPSFDRIAATTTVRTVMTRFPGLGEVLPRLSVPATILMGAEDRIYPVENMRPFANLAARELFARSWPMNCARCTHAANSP